MHTVVGYKDRTKLLAWMRAKTSIRMVSGADVYPFPEIQYVKRDAVVVASKEGIAVLFPVDRNAERSISIGSRVSVREFCEKVRGKFPADTLVEELKKRSKQRTKPSMIPGLERRGR